MKTNSRIETAVSMTLDLLNVEATPEAIQHWNEHVFRYFLSRHIGFEQCHAEWKRVDLIVDTSESVALELKLYRSVKTVNSTKSTLGWKGGAGNQNMNEFINSWNTLLELRSDSSRISHAWGKSISSLFVILVCIDDRTLNRRKFSDIYFGQFAIEPIHAWKYSSEKLDIKCGLYSVTREIGTNDFVANNMVK